MVLAQKQTNGKQQKIQIQVRIVTAISHLTVVPKMHTREKTASSTNGAGRLDVHMQKTEVRPIFINLHRNQLNGSKIIT